MEITTSTLYWILMLDGICGVLIGLATIAGIIIIILAIITIVCFIEGEEDRYKSLKILCLFFPILIIMLTTCALTPNTKQMATIIIAPKLINSKFVQNDLPKETKELYGMAKSYLKQQITETTKEK